MISRQTSGAFSLIEVNLAIFVVSMGMLTLFSLFPVGLRQVEDSHKVTQEALFADYVLSTIRANACAITEEDAADWTDIDAFRSRVMQGLPITADSGIQSITFGGADQPIQARIEIEEVGNWGRSIKLWCRAGDGSFDSTEYTIETGARD